MGGGRGGRCRCAVAVVLVPDGVSVVCRLGCVCVNSGSSVLTGRGGRVLWRCLVCGMLNVWVGADVRGGNVCASMVGQGVHGMFWIVESLWSDDVSMRRCGE